MCAFITHEALYDDDDDCLEAEGKEPPLPFPRYLDSQQTVSGSGSDSSGIENDLPGINHSLTRIKIIVIFFVIIDFLINIPANSEALHII